MRALLRDVCLLLLLVAGVINLWQIHQVAARGKYQDFGTFWEAVHGWTTTGRSLYDPAASNVVKTSVATVSLRNLTLPHGHFVFLPLAGLSLPVAGNSWLALSVLAILVALALVARELGRGPTLGELTWGCWSAPLQAHLISGHVGPALLIPMVMAWRAVRRRRWVQVGAWVGLVAGQKPFVLPLIAWLAWQRRWAACATALAMISVQVAIGGLVFGIDAYREWAGLVGDVYWQQAPLNASVWGLVTRTFGAGLTSLYAPLIPVPGVWHVVGLAAASVIVLLTWWACRRTTSLDQQWLLVLSATILIFPLGWVYYALWLLPSQLALGMPRLSALLWLVPFLMLATTPLGPWVNVTLLSSYAWGLLYWWGDAVAASRRPDACLNRHLA